MRNQRRLLFRVSSLLILVMAAVWVGGVQAQATGPHVRIAHLAPDIATIDVYVNNQMLVSGVKFGDVSAYLPVAGWNLSVAVVPSGGNPTQDGLTKAPVAIAIPPSDPSYYTIAAVGSVRNNNFALMILPLDGPPAVNAAGGTSSGTSGSNNGNTSNTSGSQPGNQAAVEATPVPGQFTDPKTPVCMGLPIRLQMQGMARVINPPAGGKPLYDDVGSTVIKEYMPANAQVTLIAGPKCANWFGTPIIWWGVDYNNVQGWTTEGKGTTYYMEPVQ